MNKLSTIYYSKVETTQMNVGNSNSINDFDMSQIKRIYFTTHLDTEVIRAWQGHTIQSRWFCCVKVVLCKIN